MGVQTEAATVEYREVCSLLNPGNGPQNLDVVFAVVARATAKQISADAWQVTLDVRARKVVVDEVGVETEVPMDDWIEAGVFDEGEPYLEKRRIRSGQQTITVTVPRKPACRYRPAQPAE
ncbi:MAG TPA: hypothetical protein VN519_14940 [Bryobacteraceae bacterium]|nr:hypothetical protein [Bryobacteraceae bacterium]